MLRLGIKVTAKVRGVLARLADVSQGGIPLRLNPIGLQARV
jgi:hypothetical protein